MWQEIIVGLIVLAAIIFVVIRVWKSFTAARRGDVCASCDCSACAEKGVSGEQCGLE
ncbi:MAG TPA: FeoB-associated Cys-rich membrane protein [Desulfomonilaceae bacterium]|nr:FeoB-associated Cys-rich membrane protein [Desulfomonilaceae bacterium]